MSKITCTQALELFILDLNRRNYSKATIKLYRYYLNKFFDYLDSIDKSKPASINLEILMAYWKHLTIYRTAKGTPYSQTSIERAITPLKQFFRFLKRQDMILFDPTEGLPPMRRRETLPRSVMTEEEIEDLLLRPNLKTLTGFRDRAIMETLYSSGIRRKELCNLTIYDIDFSGGFIRINEGKGKKDRIVPIGKIALKYLKEYLEIIRPKLSRNRINNILFLKNDGTPLKPDRLGTIIWGYVRQRSFKKPVSCHTFRHYGE